jgi:hypothetical protein
VGLEEGGNRRGKIVGVHTYHTYLPLASGYQPKLVAVAIQSVAPGRTADFEKVIKEQMKIAAKANIKGVLVSRVNNGGDPNEYWVSYLLDSFADFDELGPAYRKAIAETKILPPPAGIVTHVERSIFQFAPELSILPAAPKASQ